MGYRHTQVGYIILVVAGVIAVGYGVELARAKPSGVEHFALRSPAVTLLVIALLTALFSTLTVAIGDRRLSWSFGPGLIRKSVSLDQIAEATPVTHSLLAGFGIRYTPDGWLYNVSGRRAVKVRLLDGKQFRIGTDEPEALAEAINSSRSSMVPR